MRAAVWLALPMVSAMVVACGGSTELDAGTAGTGGSGSGGSESQSGSGGKATTDPTWSCAGQSRTSAPAGAEHSVTLHLKEVVSSQPSAGVTGRVCTQTDVECTSPISTTSSDAQGTLQITVAQNFAGYVALEKDGFVPGMYFLPHTDSDLETSVQTVTFANWKLLLRALQAEEDFTGGHALLSAVDCGGAPAEGLRFSSKDVPTQDFFYAQGGIPTRDAKETDVSGFGGLLNGTAGTALIEGVTNEGTVSSVSLLLKPGTISYAKLIPGE